MNKGIVQTRFKWFLVRRKEIVLIRVLKYKKRLFVFQQAKCQFLDLTTSVPNDKKSLISETYIPFQYCRSLQSIHLCLLPLGNLTVVFDIPKVAVINRWHKELYYRKCVNMKICTTLYMFHICIMTFTFKHVHLVKKLKQ